MKRPPHFLKVLALLGAGNRNDVIALRQHPGQRKLPGADTFIGCQRLHLLHQLQVFAEVFALETRVEATVIIGAEVIRAFQCARQEATAERAVGDKCNTQALAGGEATVMFLSRLHNEYSLCRALIGCTL